MFKKKLVILLNLLLLINVLNTNGMGDQTETDPGTNTSGGSGTGSGGGSSQNTGVSTELKGQKKRAELKVLELKKIGNLTKTQNEELDFILIKIKKATTADEINSLVKSAEEITEFSKIDHSSKKKDNKNEEKEKRRIAEAELNKEKEDKNKQEKNKKKEQEALIAKEASNKNKKEKNNKEEIIIGGTLLEKNKKSKEQEEAQKKASKESEKEKEVALITVERKNAQNNRGSNNQEKKFLLATEIKKKENNKQKEEKEKEVEKTGKSDENKATREVDSLKKRGLKASTILVKKLKKSGKSLKNEFEKILNTIEKAYGSIFGPILVCDILSKEDFFALLSASQKLGAQGVIFYNSYSPITTGNINAEGKEFICLSGAAKEGNVQSLLEKYGIISILITGNNSDVRWNALQIADTSNNHTAAFISQIINGQTFGNMQLTTGPNAYNNGNYNSESILNPLLVDGINKFATNYKLKSIKEPSKKTN